MGTQKSVNILAKCILLCPRGVYQFEWESPSFIIYIEPHLLSILINIMFHALMGRFQLEIFTYLSTVVTLTCRVFFPVGLSSLARHFQQVL